MKRPVVWLTDKPTSMPLLVRHVFPILWENNITSMIGVLDGSKQTVGALANAVYDIWVSTGVDFGYDDAEMAKFESLIRLSECTLYGTDTVCALNYDSTDKEEWVHNVISRFPRNAVFGVDLATRTTPKALAQSISLYSVLKESQIPVFLFNTFVAPARSTHLWLNVCEKTTGANVSDVIVYNGRGLPVENRINIPRLANYLIDITSDTGVCAVE